MSNRKSMTWLLCTTWALKLKKVHRFNTLNEWWACLSHSSEVLGSNLMWNLNMFYLKILRTSIWGLLKAKLSKWVDMNGCWYIWEHIYICIAANVKMPHRGFMMTTVWAWIEFLHWTSFPWGKLINQHHWMACIWFWSFYETCIDPDIFRNDVEKG